MRPTVEFGLNVLLCVVCLLVGANAALSLWDRVSPGSRPPGGAQAVAAGFQAGEPVPALAEYSYQQRNATLILAVRSSCVFCTGSMPFYRRLVEKLGSTPGVTLVALSAEPVEVTTKYLQSNGVAIGTVRTSTDSSWKIAGTPTLVLVDGGGVVRDVWIGQLDGDAEADVITTIIEASKRGRS